MVLHKPCLYKPTQGPRELMSLLHQHWCNHYRRLASGPNLTGRGGTKLVLREKPQEQQNT